MNKLVETLVAGLTGTRQHVVKFTITDGNQLSDWQGFSPVGLTRFVTVETDANCPAQELTLFSRDKEDQVEKEVQNFSLTGGANFVYSVNDTAPISAVIDGKQLRWRLASAMSGSDTVIRVRVV